MKMTSAWILWKLLLNIVMFKIVLALHPNDTHIPEIVYDLCPYAHICNKPASRVLSGENLVSCCSSCSCDKDCGLSLDCCFEDLDQYKLEARGKVACVDAVVRVNNYVQTDVMKNGYLMVQSCNFDKVDTDIRRRCNYTDSHGKSTFAPVSYFDKSVIFINKECAMCNSVNIYKTKAWNYLYRPAFQHLDSLEHSIPTSLNNHLGTYLYVPPINENWSNKRCYKKTVAVEKCDLSNVWSYTCKHLRSTYRSTYGKIFDNVACQLCTGMEVKYIGTTCERASMKEPGIPKLTMLLNKEVIDILDMSDMQTAKDLMITKLYCDPYEEIKDMCQPIYCPEGMFRTPNGCTYFALKWFAPWAMIQIKLLPKTGTMLAETDLLLLGYEERRRPLMWLKVPCRKVRISSVELFYSTSMNTINHKANGSETSKYVTSLIARVWKSFDNFTGMDPSVIIPLFHKCATGIWEAKLWNKIYRFDSYFDKYSVYIQDGQSRKTKWPPDGKSTFTEAPADNALYTKLAEGPTSVSDFKYVGINLKKPYFCNQVQLPSNDIRVRPGEIFIISRNITLGNNEYIVNYPMELINDKVRAFNESTFSVCSEDYYHTRNYASTTRRNDVFWRNVNGLLLIYITQLSFK